MNIKHTRIRREPRKKTRRNVRSSRRQYRLDYETDELNQLHTEAVTSKELNDLANENSITEEDEDEDEEEDEDENGNANENNQENLNEENNNEEKIDDANGITKEDILQQLNEAQNIEERVDLFAKWTDKFGFEAVLSRVPILGDIGPAIISTGFLFDQGRKMGLGRMEMLKIFGYQTVDAVLGAIPLVGNVIDFFFKSNKYSAKVFEKHVEKLKKAAIEKGATQEEIAELDRVSKQTMNKLGEQTNNKGTTENGQQNGNRGNENRGTGRKVDSKALNKEKIEQIEKKLNTTVSETTDKIDSRVNGAVKIGEKVDRIEEKIDKL